jgi:hypothetical protein
MDVETKVVSLSLLAAFTLIGLIWFAISLTKPDCPPGLAAIRLSKYEGGGWHCLPPRPCIDNRFLAYLFDRKCQSPSSVRL